MRYAAMCIGFLLVGVSMAIPMKYAFLPTDDVMSITELFVFVLLNVTGSAMYWRNV